MALYISSVEIPLLQIIRHPFLAISLSRLSGIILYKHLKHNEITWVKRKFQSRNRRILVTNITRSTDQIRLPITLIGIYPLDKKSASIALITAISGSVDQLERYVRKTEKRIPELLQIIKEWH